MHKVAKAFNMKAFEITDHPDDIFNVLEPEMINQPLLLNIKTNRLFWHAGAGIDDPKIFDRHKYMKKKVEGSEDIIKSSELFVKEIWQKCLSR